MPRPGFYNDNEYRAYPFVFSTALSQLPNSAIVDAGVVMRVDANFDDAIGTVWLQSISREGDKFYFALRATGVLYPLIFERDVTSNEWAIEYVESAPQVPSGNDPCAGFNDPVWEGFLVTGPLKELQDVLQVDGTLTFALNQHQLEPGRIQNLSKGYLRSISVGNYDRPFIPACDASSALVEPTIILNKECLQGDIRFKEGYNCTIRQVSWDNEIRIGAAVGSGSDVDEEFCAHGSELALFTGEVPFYNDFDIEVETLVERDGIPPENRMAGMLVKTKSPSVIWRLKPDLITWRAEKNFFVRGPACDELIFTINGLGGPDVTITGGPGINIATQTDPPLITITQNVGAAGNCQTPQSES